MAKKFRCKKIVLSLSAIGAIALSQFAGAAAFQLWEQDAASLGNYHAGAVSEAADASTSFYNPAGLVFIKNQQMVLGGDAVLTNFQFNGNVKVSTLDDPTLPHAARAQGGSFNFIPFGHYAAPITDSLVFGLSAVVPYGLKTDYGADSFTRYAATLTSVQVIDVSPSLGLALTDKLSVGLGWDIQRIRGQFNQYATAGDDSPEIQTTSNNEGNGDAYGYHIGALFQMTPKTRVGLAYHSQVVHHLTGHSTFTGGLANDASGGTQYSNNLQTTVTLPPSTTLSVFHTINPTWDVMGSVTYTQWSVFKDLILTNVAGIDQNFVSTNNLIVDVAQNFRNSWTYSIGTNYHANESWMFRAGAGFDETPTSNRYRNLQLPDTDRIVVSMGAHFQATKTIGFDAGWSHIFAMNTTINDRGQQVGGQFVTTDGSVRGGADVYGLQMKWDIV